MQGSAGVASSLISPDLLPLIPEQSAVNARLRVQASGMPPPGSVDVNRLRRSRLYNRDGSFRPRLDSSATDSALTTPLGDVLIRSFDAPQLEGAGTIVHFHGGGWALGSVYEQDEQLAEIRDRTAAAVVSVDYPLAPETNMPRALDVAACALETLMTRDPSAQVAVIGESAGAHVALHAILRLPVKLRARVAALSLAYGIYDLSMTPSQRSWGTEFLGLSTDWLLWFYAQALPGLTRDERSDPAYSPLHRDLRGLPPLLLSVGELDPLLDDSLFLFERCRAAYNRVELAVYPQAPHGFNHQDTAMADRCNSRIASFVVAGLRRGQ